jgi:hypothetical protein
MKHLFSFFFAFLLATGFFSACSSDKKEDPTPQTGTVQGQITPANSITTVTATDSVNHVTSATPTASGEYTFALPKGNYVLHFTPANGFTVPVDQLISVSAGGITIPDPTNVTQSGGTATLTVDGTAVTVSLVRAGVASGELDLTLLSATGQTTVLHIYPYQGTARTDSFAGFSDNRLRYTASVGGPEWISPATGTPTGSSIVTPTGTSPVRVSGSFSCTLQPYAGGATGPKVVAGTFTNVAY